MLFHVPPRRGCRLYALALVPVLGPADVSRDASRSPALSPAPAPRYQSPSLSPERIKSDVSQVSHAVSLSQLPAHVVSPCTFCMATLSAEHLVYFTVATHNDIHVTACAPQRINFVVNGHSKC